jgi:hypothetical protein
MTLERPLFICDHAERLICPLPLKIDPYSGCSTQCAYCSSNGLRTGNGNGNGNQRRPIHRESLLQAQQHSDGKATNRSEKPYPDRSLKRSITASGETIPCNPAGSEDLAGQRVPMCCNNQVPYSAHRSQLSCYLARVEKSIKLILKYDNHIKWRDLY